MSDHHHQQQQAEEEVAVVTTYYLLPLDIICGPIASYLDRCSFNNLGLSCRSIHQRLDALSETNILWPDVVRLFLHSYARCFAFSSCGCYLACGDMQGQVTIWNRKSGKSNIVWRPNNNNNNNNNNSTTVDDDDSSSTADAVNIHTISIGWINRISIWKREWIVCGNTESNTLYFYNIHTQQQQQIMLPQLIRKILIPKDKYLYVLTGHNRYSMLGDNMFLCKDIGGIGIDEEEEEQEEDDTDFLTSFVHCQGFPKCVLDVVPLDTEAFICWTKERQRTNNNRNDDNDNDNNDGILVTKIIFWDQKSGQSRTVPILANTTTTTSDGDEYKYNDDDGNNENYHHRHVVDPDITILAISSNTGTTATEGRVLLGIAYRTGHCVWLDLWRYDWWMGEDDVDDQWTYHGHFPLHSHCDNVNILHLVDDKTWLIADTRSEQFFVWYNGECIRSLQANPNRFDVAYYGSYIAWIAWGSTMWIRDITKFWNNNNDDGNNNENGRGGHSELVVRGTGEFI